MGNRPRAALARAAAIWLAWRQPSGTAQAAIAARRAGGDVAGL
ncbi:MAG TPA: hypothetical protein VFQ77_18975 [Pseudonocardiaceae bacterium]|nr:hypothetical protein [Pseudonocardiaceae bacterium]